MRKISTSGIAFLISAVIALGLGGCGTGENFDQAGGTNSTQPSTVTVKTGTLATDSWGYTGSAPVRVTAPGTTEGLSPWAPAGIAAKATTPNASSIFFITTPETPRRPKGLIVSRIKHASR